MPHRRHGSSGVTRHRRGDLGRMCRMALPALLLAVPAAGAMLNLVVVYVDDSPPVPDGLDGAAGVAISPTGGHAYAVGQEDDALVVFTRDATAEALSFVEVLSDQVGGVFGLAGASAVAVSPDSRHVYATADASDALTVFARDPSADDLAFVEAHLQGVGGVFGLDGASSVAATVDGRHVYVTGAESDSLAVFARDASLDSLAFVDAVVDGVGGVDGLAGASAVTEDPISGSLFVAGAVDDSVAVFVRDPAGDELIHLVTFTDGVGRVDGLDGAAAVLVIPGGSNLYVAGRDEDAIAVFHAPRGVLKFLQVVRNGRHGVTGLIAPAALALSEDGRFLYAATAGGSTITAFRREASNGGLTFLDSFVVAGPPRVQNAHALATSPDGKHLLAASRTADAVALFRQDGVFSDGFESGDTSVWSNASP